MSRNFIKNIEKVIEEKPRESLSLGLTKPGIKILWKSWDDLKRAGLIPMLIVVVVLSAAVKIYVGDLSLSPFNLIRWLGISIIVCLFLLISFLLDIFASFSEIKKFKDNESGHINILALWKDVFTNPLCGIILITVMTFGISSAQDLSEYYRVNASTWYDVNLWALEASVFYALKNSLIDIPIFWDRVYFAYWLYLMLVYCVLYRQRKFYDLAVMNLAIIFCYFLTRLAAIQYPTAGPAFYKPDLFYLSGTVSGVTQTLLIKYMQGGIPQNGFIPGTMGMPSLHIGVTVMAAWFLARNIRWTLWLSVTWIFLIWLSTVMLGWHYALDGVGGIVVVLISVLATLGILKVIRV